MDSAILDVAIGLALLYLMLSLLVSLTSEFISRLFDLRAKTLRGWLERFLDGEVKTPLPGVLTSNTTTKAFYDLPLITALKNKKAKHLPSYIPSKTFATALLDLALPAKDGMPDSLKASITGVEGTNLPPQVKKVIIAHLRMADNNLEKTREELALWFDGAMERVSGWYARRMQVFTLLIALAVTLIANADTFLMADKLWQDDSFRQATAEYAERVLQGDIIQTCVVDEKEQTSNDRQACISSIEEVFSSLNLPLFEHSAQWQTLIADSKVNVGFGLRWLIGLVVTTAALSFGARFWFDVLTKLVNIRLTGKPPEESTKPS